MRTVITGIGRLINPDKEHFRERINSLGNSIAQIKLSNDIERIAVLAAAYALEDARIQSPLSNDSVGIYAGIDEGIDGIKFRYYEKVLREGPLGASPALFPFTSPNAVTSQIAIALDIRGECITLPAGIISGARAIGYASECIMLGKTDIALVGSTTCIDDELKIIIAGSDSGYAQSLSDGSAFLVMESQKHAENRNAKIYGEIVCCTEMFRDISNKEQLIAETISIVAKCSGIKADRISTVNLLIRENFLFHDPKIKIFKPYYMSASFALMLSDAVIDTNFKGYALFIAADRAGNVAAVLVSK